MTTHSPAYITVTIDAETAAANARPHSEHADGSRSFVLTTGDPIYIYAATSDDLEALGVALIDLADEWADS